MAKSNTACVSSQGNLLEAKGLVCNTLQSLQIWGKRLLIEECNRTAEAPAKSRDNTLMNSTFKGHDITKV